MSDRDDEENSSTHGDEATMNEIIDKLASRHIARLLSKLGDTIAPVVESEIKREFRFLADDIKQVHTENEYEQEENQGNH
jgi:hypothetical protein